MSPAYLKSEIPFLRRIKCKKVAYCIDTWESTLDDWKEELKLAGIDTVFLAYKSSMRAFSKFVSNVFFLPQSYNSRWFGNVLSRKKTNLMMQIGRKNDSLDEYAMRYLKDSNLSDKDYIREKIKGQIIYDKFSNLAEEMSKTRFFLLAPRNLNEEKVTGEISDVTARFYEGMASKTLLIGYKPKDTFDELFPYKNAMIEVENYDDFRNKIDYYWQNEDEYRKIVDYNYDYVIKHHTWSKRADTVVSILSSEII